MIAWCRLHFFCGSAFFLKDNLFAKWQRLQRVCIRYTMRFHPKTSEFHVLSQRARCIMASTTFCCTNRCLVIFFLDFSAGSFERTYLWSCIICMPLYYYFYRNIIGEIFHLIAIMQWTAEHRLDCGQRFFSPTLCYIIYTPGLLLMLIPVKLPSSTKGWGHLNRLYWIAKIYYINMF